MSKSTADSNKELVLGLLRESGDRPVSLVDLRGRGVPNPAAVIYELELAGFPIDRVTRRGSLVGVRLLEPRDATVPLRPPHRFRR
jgi:hypothetical protein